MRWLKETVWKVEVELLLILLTKQPSLDILLESIGKSIPSCCTDLKQVPDSTVTCIPLTWRHCARRPVWHKHSSCAHPCTGSRGANKCALISAQGFSKWCVQNTSATMLVTTQISGPKPWFHFWGLGLGLEVNSHLTSMSDCSDNAIDINEEHPW